MNERQLRALLITPDVAEFLISLHEKFENIRYHLLMRRRTRWRALSKNNLSSHRFEMSSFRDADVL